MFLLFNAGSLILYSIVISGFDVFLLVVNTIQFNSMLIKEFYGQGLFK